MKNQNKKTVNVKKGQVWTLDYLIGLFLFIVVLFSAIVIMKEYMSERDTFKETARESDHIASILLSEEISNTSYSNLSLLIIAENNRINLTKLQEFDALSYAQKKLMFQNSGEYLFYFYNGTIINETVCFRGYNLTGCTLELPSNTTNVAKTERLVILDSEIVKMVVLTWN